MYAQLYTYNLLRLDRGHGRLEGVISCVFWYRWVKVIWAREGQREDCDTS